MTPSTCLNALKERTDNRNTALSGNTAARHQGTHGSLNMPTLLAQIAPQRSSQYAALADALAPCELQLSPLGKLMGETEAVTLGGQKYLKFSVTAERENLQTEELGMLSMTSAFFICYEEIEGIPGPLLQPIETGFEPVLPQELSMARRYRGKTNELFTHFLCNVARYSSAFSHDPWNELSVFDPLAGGGTTLFTALVLGANAAGAEQVSKDVKSTATFIKEFTREKGIVCEGKSERLKGIGNRWLFRIGEGSHQRCVLGCGDTLDSPRLISGFRPHLVVTDLPYGIQHKGKLTGLLSRALPVWESLLRSGGTTVFAWESRRFPRPEMIKLVESSCGMKVLDAPPYDGMVHRVDRVIRERDVIVAGPS